MRVGDTFVLGPFDNAEGAVNKVQETLEFFISCVPWINLS